VNLYEVTFKRDGSVQSVTLLPTGHAPTRFVVQARNEGEAKQVAWRLYCSVKKEKAKVRLAAEGRCSCGRKRDRVLNGKPLKTCLVCAERRKTYHRNFTVREQSGTVGQGIAERDESARLAANHERQRDRRAELRLEVLCEVQQQWANARNVGVFTKWLQDQIALCTGEKHVA
jgi:hypothetical protein